MKKYDWEGITREFRAGQMSLREMQDIFGIPVSTLRREMKKRGIERDLTQAVQQQIRSDLSRPDEVPAGATEQDIIDLAARRGVEVVRQHRAMLGKLHKISTGYIDKLLSILEGKGEGVEVEVVRNGKPAGVKVVIPLLGSSQSVVDALRKVTASVARLIPLERQAFNIDLLPPENQGEDGPEEKADDAILDEINERIGRIEEKMSA